MRVAVLVDSDASVLGGSDALGAPPRECAPDDLQNALRSLGFEVIPSLDAVSPGDTVLLHARGTTADGTWLRAVVSQLAARKPESALVVAELTHDGPSEDALVAADHVEAVRAAINPRANGVAAIIGVRASSLGASPLAFTELLTRIAVDVADEPASSGVARLSAVSDRLRASGERHAAAQSYAVVKGDKGETDFEIARSERPSLSALIALADGARDRAEWVHARAGYRAAVAFARDGESLGSVWSRLGAMERARCDEDEAIRAYERAVAARPTDREALDALVELASEKGDVTRATAWAKQRVELIESPGDKVDELFALARASLSELSDMLGAIALLERARAIEPRDDVLEALRRAYKKQANWPKLVEILGELADSAPTDAEKAARRFAQARVALDKMHDDTRAVGYLTLALEEDPTHDEALDVLVEIRSSLGEHAELGRTLERLAGRLEGMGEAERALDVRVRLDGLPSEVLDVPAPAPTPVVDLSTLDADATGPQDAFPAAHLTERTLPDADGTGEAEIISVVSVETGKRAAVAEKLLAEGDEGGALEELEETLSGSPLDETTHARLYGLHMQAERHDRAFLSAMALEELGILAPEREAWLEQARGAGALRVRALLDAGAWELLRGAGSDEVVESLFAAISKAAIAAQVDDRRARRKLPSLDPARKQAKESTASIVASFQWAARVLGVDCPDLYVFEDVPGDVAAVPAHEPVAVLGPQVLSGRSTKELAFIVGKHLTYYRPEYAVLLYYPTIQDLTLLVLAAVQLAMPAMPVPPSVATQVESLRTRLAAHLGDAARTAMVAAVHRLDARGGRMDLGAWVQSVEATAARVGLVLSGDLKSTMARVREESRATSCVTLDEARADLVRFCVSRAHADIRAEYALVTSSWPPAQMSGVRSRDDYATPVWNLTSAGALRG